MTGLITILTTVIGLAFLITFIFGLSQLIRKIGLPLFIISICLLAILGLTMFISSYVPTASNYQVLSIKQHPTATEHTDFISFESYPTPSA